MKYLLVTPIILFLCLHLSTYFGYAPDGQLVTLLSIPLLGYFIYSIFLLMESKRSNKSDLLESILGNIKVKPFFIGLILVGYFFLNFFVSISIGGNTKIEDDKYFALKTNPKEYYEISKEEYLYRQPYQKRGITGHIFIFGLIGFFCINTFKLNPKERT